MFSSVAFVTEVGKCCTMRSFFIICLNWFVLVSTSKSDKISTNNYTSERTKRSAAYDQLQDKQLNDVVVHLNSVNIPEITRVANNYLQLERAMNLKFDQHFTILQQLEKFQIKIKSDLEVRVYDLQKKNGILEKSLRTTKDEIHNILMASKKILTENEKLRSEMKSKTEASQLEYEKMTNKIQDLERSNANMTDKLNKLILKGKKQEDVTDITFKNIDLQIRTLNQTFLISTQQNDQKWKMQMKIDEEHRSNLRSAKNENVALSNKFSSIINEVKSASQEIQQLKNAIFRHGTEIQQLKQSVAITEQQTSAKFHKLEMSSESLRHNVETKIQNLKSTQQNAFTNAQQLQSEIYQLRHKSDGETRNLWKQLDMVNSKSHSLQNSVNQLLGVSQCTTNTLKYLVGAFRSL